MDPPNSTTSTRMHNERSYEAMSVKNLRSLLILRGFDCSQCLEKADLIAAARRLDATNYDDEAHKLFQQLNLEPALASHYANLNAIWKHPTDGGGSVYVGNVTAASNRQTLQERNIVAVINCQDATSKNYFQDDPQITYHRFVISELAWKVSYEQRDGGAGGITPMNGGFQQSFDFIQTHIEQGGSVLIHCLAGAHRAGTVGTAWIMYQTGKDVQDALALAKKCRPIINPFGLLLELLSYLESELKAVEHHA